MYVVVIGIDRYRAWGTLRNAVADAKGAQATFAKLGFEVRPGLLDEAATGAAMTNLVTEDLRTLGPNDSLVVFFAGHGYTVTTPYDDGTWSKRGFLIPVDAKPAGGEGNGTWVSLDSWLRDVAHLPAKHILVILDACHSGIALDPVVRWRGEDIRNADSFDALRVRRSRRIITSALDDQTVLDGGPVPGHSLFTGCLIEALTGGAVATVGRHFVTGSEIGLHVQRRVSTYPNANPRQTPDFGALELDNRGELIIELPRPLDDSQEPSHLGVDGIRPLNFARGADASPAPTSPQADVILESGVDSIKPRVATTKRAIAATRVDGSQSLPQAEPTAPAAGLGSAPADSRPETTTAAPVSDMQSSASPIVSAPQPSGRKPSSMLDAAFVAALDRHDLVRRTRRDVLTVVAADPTTAVTGWATWAAGRGLLTLVAEGNGLDATITSLLGQMPWLRALPAARSRFAAAAQLEVEAVDVALDSAPSLEAREVWIEEVAQHDMRVRVSGWLLAMLREPWAPGPELAAAPVQGSDLLSILCALATPVTVLLHHAVPTAPWLEQAVQTAAELIEFLPHQAVAIAVPGDLAHSLTRMRPESAVFAMARRGVVPLATKPPRPIDPAHSRTEHVLHAALARDRRTAGLFQPNVRVPVHGHERAIEVDLVARDALLAIQIDDWYQARDPQAYTRERMKDSFLSRAQFFVMRFLAEDIERRLEQTVNEIALGLAGRQASGSFVESSQ